MRFKPISLPVTSYKSMEYFPAVGARYPPKPITSVGAFYIKTAAISVTV